MRTLDAITVTFAGLLAVAAVVVVADPALRERIVQVRPSPADAGVQAVQPASAAPRVVEVGGIEPASTPAVVHAAAPALATAPSPADASATTLAIPIQGITADQLADTFGDARGGDRRHEALDIMAPAGTPVLAVADGHIEKLFDSERGGLTIYQFDPDGRHAYYYAHLQGYAPGLAEKQQVKRGQLLGHVGSTGNADPAAPHLHFAIFVLGPERHWWEGTAINPYPLLRGGASLTP